MKKAIVFLLLGAVLGAVGWRYYQRSQNPTLEQRVGRAAEKTREAVVEAKNEVANKAGDSKSKSESIKQELAKTGELVSSGAKTVGEHLDDARIVALIKSKYVMDKNLSALAITVDCHDGDVRLTGSVSAPEYIGAAVTLAQGTSGVRSVVAQLVVRN